MDEDADSPRLARSEGLPFRGLAQAGGTVEGECRAEPVDSGPSPGVPAPAGTARSAKVGFPERKGPVPIFGRRRVSGNTRLSGGRVFQ